MIRLALCTVLMALQPSISAAKSYEVIRFFDWNKSVKEPLDKVPVVNGNGQFIGYLQDTLTVYKDEALKFRITRQGLEGIFTVHPSRGFEVSLKIVQGNYNTKTEGKRFCVNKYFQLLPAGAENCAKTIRVDTIRRTQIYPVVNVGYARFENAGSVAKFAFVLSPPDAKVDIKTSVSVDNVKPTDNNITQSRVADQYKGDIIARSAFNLDPLKIVGNFSDTDEFYLNGRQIRASANAFFIKRDKLLEKNQLLIRRSTDIANCRKRFRNSSENLTLSCGWEVW